jgi:hypothetical protein
MPHMKHGISVNLVMAGLVPAIHVFLHARR